MPHQALRLQFPRKVFPHPVLSWIAAAFLLTSASACAVDITGAAPQAAASDYQVKLADYERIHGAYEQQAAAYWDAVAAKRRLRNAKRRHHQQIALSDYVLTQPPVYTGPRKPVDPNAPPQPPSEKPAVPVVADFLEAARAQWGFVPDRPRSEREFKRAYAAAARAGGLHKDQVVGIYAFETAGHGAYDTQAGLLFDRPGARAISPALGYNQLLSTLTLSLLAEHGHAIVAALREKERQLSGEARVHMAHKITVLRRMIAFARSVPHRWKEYDRVAKHTAKGMGVHAVLLDVDIGPLLQVQNLANSLRFARAKGYTGHMSAAELELMNLTGAGNGIDMVMMPQALREQVPTANFFVPAGYWRNPIARRSQVVAGLIAEIQDHINRAEKIPARKSWRRRSDEGSTHKFAEHHVCSPSRSRHQFSRLACPPRAAPSRSRRARSACRGERAFHNRLNGRKMNA